MQFKEEIARLKEEATALNDQLVELKIEIVQLQGQKANWGKKVQELEVNLSDMEEDLRVKEAMVMSLRNDLAAGDQQPFPTWVVLLVTACVVLAAVLMKL